MVPMTLAEVAAATGGQVLAASPDLVVPGPVVVDSREAVPGALFVALAGERTDGHEFARQACRAGAVAVLAARPVGAPAVVVDDPVAALGRLASAALARLAGVTVVAITGSSGKTSTKDLLAGLLERLGPTVAPVGSYNNEIGHPLTVLRAGPDTRYLVLEASARAAGDIAHLCTIAPPGVGVVLNVGSAHVGVFGSREAIAAAKGELVEALPPDGVAVLNADDPVVSAMGARTPARAVRFGLSEAAEVRASDVRLDGLGRARFVLSAGEDRAQVSLRLVGEHQVSNALAAAAVAVELGLRLDEVAAGLGAATPRSRWRMEVTERADGVVVINDAYNANPESMRAALKALAGMGRGGRRTWAVLGEMRELGEAAREEHDAIGRLAVRLDIRRLVAVGPGARLMHMGASLEGSWSNESVEVADADAAIALLRDELAPGDVVLVKASRAAGLERVAAALLAGAPA